jgi:hypothetical protein
MWPRFTLIEETLRSVFFFFGLAFRAAAFFFATAFFAVFFAVFLAVMMERLAPISHPVA